MAKHIDYSDVHQLPPWQRWTIISIIVLMAASFTLSGVMLVVVQGWFDPNQRGGTIGKIGDDVLDKDLFRLRARIVSQLGANDAVFLRVPYRDPFTENLGYDTYPQILRTKRLFAQPNLERNDLFGVDETGRIVWIHALLLELAKAEGITVALPYVGEIGRVAMTALEPPLQGGDEKVYQQEVRDREAAYKGKVINESGFPSVERFEAVLQEFLIVREYMRRIVDKAPVSSNKLLAQFNAARREINLDVLQISARDDAVLARAREALARERAQAKLMADLMTMGTGLTPDAYPDPVREYYETHTDEFMDARVRAVVIAALFDDLRPQVKLTTEEIQLYYDHYKVDLFRASLTDEQVDAILAHERSKREQLQTNTGTGDDTGNGNDGDGTFPAEGAVQLRVRAAKADTVFPNTAGAIVLRLQIGNGTGTPVYADRLTLATTGTLAQTAIVRVRIVHDANGNGVAEPEEATLGESTWLGSPTEVTLDREHFVARGAENAEQWLVLVDIVDNATVGSHVSFSVPSAGMLDESKTQLIDAQGVPVVGGTITVAETNAQWEARRRDELRYRPLADVRAEVVAALQDRKVEAFAGEIMKALDKQIRDRISVNNTAWQRQEELARTRRDVARSTAALFYGDPSSAMQRPGVLPALANLRNRLDREFADQRNFVGLTAAPDIQGGTPVKSVRVDLARSALDNLSRGIVDNAFNTFLRESRLSTDLDNTSTNMLLAARGELADITGKLRAIQGDVSIEAEQQRTRFAIQTAELENRVTIAELMQTCAQNLQRDLRLAVLRTQLTLDGYPDDGELNATLLNILLRDLRRELGRAIQGLETITDLQATARTARAAARAQDDAYDRFARDRQRVVGDLAGILPPVLLARQTLPDGPLAGTPINLPVYRLEQDIRSNGIRIGGLWNAGLPAFQVTETVSVDDLLKDDSLRLRLPGLFRDAKAWDLNRGVSIGQFSLDALLADKDVNAADRLTVGAYTPVLGVRNRGYYMVALVEREPRRVPSFEEVREKATEKYLAMRANEIAREMAENLRLELIARDRQLRAMDGQQLAAELRANCRDANKSWMLPPAPRALPVGHARATIEWPDIGKMAHALDERGGSKEQRVIAREALMAFAFAHTAERYGLNHVQTGWLRPGGDIPGIQLAGSSDADDQLVKLAFTLVPGLELTPVMEEEYAVDPDKFGEETYNSYVIGRSLGTRAPAKAVAVSDVDAQLIDMRRTYEQATRVLASPDFSPLFELPLLIARVKELTGKDVKIDAWSPDSVRTGDDGGDEPQSP